jgi:hypothetical protein
MIKVAVWLRAETGDGASVVVGTLVFGGTDVVVDFGVAVVVVFTVEELLHAEAPTATAARPSTTSSLSTMRGYLRGSP